MDKIAFIADVHVANHRQHGGKTISGINERCRLALDALHKACWMARDADAKCLVVLGDLFDTSRPEPQVVTGVQEALAGFHFASGGVVYIIAGNHDLVSMEPGDHALGPLACSHVEIINGGECRVVDRPPVQLVLASFSVEPALDWLRKAVISALPNLAPIGRRVLCLHAGISDAETPPWLRDCADQVPVDLLTQAMEGSKFDLTMAGNWHDHRSWTIGNSKVIQAGALVPTGWDNPGLNGYGGVYIVDASNPGNNCQRLEVGGPRFVTAKFGQDTELLRELHGKIGQNKVFMRYKCRPEEAAGALQTLDNLKGYNMIHAGEVVVHKDVAVAERAAEAARSAGTLEEALAGYCGTLEVPAGVDSKEVLERSRNYLKCG